MAKSLAAAVIMIASTIEPASAAERYLCIGEKATGFAWNGSTWEQGTFRVEDDKFLVEQVDPYLIDETKINFHVTMIGTSEPKHTCSRYELNDTSGPHN